MEQWKNAAIAGDRTPQEIQERIDEDKRKTEPYPKKRNI
jgi:hypothetical protein